jgi:hypothetical protein
MALVYDLLGLASGVGGVYFLVRGVGALEKGSLVAGLVSIIIGLIVFRSGLELLKVGAASRVAGQGPSRLSNAGAEVAEAKLESRAK